MADIIPRDEEGDVPEADGDSYVLEANEHYFYLIPLGDQGRALAHLQWGATLSATVTLEDSGLDNKAAFSLDAGDWIEENPDNAYVALDGDNVAPDGSTLQIVAGAIGGAAYHIGPSAAPRTRLHVHATAEGTLRIGAGAR